MKYADDFDIIFPCCPSTQSGLIGSLTCRHCDFTVYRPSYESGIDSTAFFDEMYKQMVKHLEETHPEKLALKS